MAALEEAHSRLLEQNRTMQEQLQVLLGRNRQEQCSDAMPCS